MQPAFDLSVSVVLPCYNGMPYLPEALDSVLAQTHTPRQIIVVDDGSTDNSADVVRDYAKKHPKAGIELVQQANGGEAAARNAGNARATAAWIAIFDADDMWDPSKLEKQLAAAADVGRKCVMVHTGITAHLPDGSLSHSDLDIGRRRTGRCTAALVEHGAIGHPSILVRRDAMNQIGGYDTTITNAIDIDLYFRLSLVGHFAFVAEHLLHYRVHDKQMSRDVLGQVKSHHKVIRQFFCRRPDLAAKIGRDTIKTAMADHLVTKIESMYWRRRGSEFRALLDYAERSDIDTTAIREWRKRRNYPMWLARVKDRLDPGRRSA